MTTQFKNGFNPKNLEALRVSLNAVLKDAGFDDLEFDTGKIRYENAKCTIQLEVKVKGLDSMEDSMLKSRMEALNLRAVGTGGRTLVEYKARNHRYPFIFEMGGKRYKCTEAQAALYFAK